MRRSYSASSFKTPSIFAKTPYILKALCTVLCLLLIKNKGSRFVFCNTLKCYSLKLIEKSIFEKHLSLRKRLLKSDRSTVSHTQVRNVNGSPHCSKRPKPDSTWSYPSVQGNSTLWKQPHFESCTRFKEMHNHRLKLKKLQKLYLSAVSFKASEES